MQYISKISMVTVNCEFFWEVLGDNTLLGLVVQVSVCEMPMHSTTALQWISQQFWNSMIMSLQVSYNIVLH